MALVSDTVFSLLVLASLGFGASTIGFATLWLRARERAIRAEERAGPAPVAADNRVDRLERALDTIAAEVEQVSEGQRFVSRLLEQRAERQPAR